MIVDMAADMEIVFEDSGEEATVKGTPVTVLYDAPGAVVSPGFSGLQTDDPRIGMRQADVDALSLDYQDPVTVRGRDLVVKLVGDPDEAGLCIVTLMEEQS